MRKQLVSFFVLTCLYSTQCPPGMECLVDPSGHGECRTLSYNTPKATEGKPGQWCTFNFDCGDGYLCVKPNPNTYGKCTKEE